MNQVVAIQQPSLIASMARSYDMDPKTFAATIRATCLPANASNEEFAAFLMVAREFGLNPITREIYAFPKKGGGIQPIVGIDGWFNLINSHPQCDGVEFDDHKDDKGNLTAITCRIYRKDRGRPTSVTEYMNECKRPTEPWQKWPARMLRHKAAIQCARYAFGFAGIIDPEEAERSPEVITGNVVAPPPPAQEAEPAVEAEVIDTAIETAEERAPLNIAEFLTELVAAMATAKTEDEVIEIWDGHDVEATLTDNEDALQRAFDLRADRLVALNPINGG